jgi:hypothetical protein
LKDSESNTGQIVNINCIEELGNGSGRHEERATSLEGIVRGLRRVIGGDEYFTILAQKDIAFTYSSLGRFEDAHELSLQVLEGTQKIFGPDHPYSLSAAADLVTTYEMTGQIDEARRSNFKLLQNQKRVLGYGDENTRESVRVFERLNPGSIWRRDILYCTGLEPDKQSMVLIAMLEACTE